MKKARIVEPAAIVVCPDTGKEFKVTHAIDVQGWIDLGYTVKGKAKEVETKKVEAPKNDPEKKEPKKTESDDTSEIDYDQMTDDEFIEAVKETLVDLKADDAKRVAKILGIEYTNKKDTMIIAQDKLNEEL